MTMTATTILRTVCRTPAQHTDLLSGTPLMKRLLLAALAALSLSGCVLLDDDFWEDSYDYPSDDCDCDDGDY